MKKQTEYSKICEKINAMAKANASRFCEWLGTSEAMKGQGIDKQALKEKMFVVVDKLTDPMNVETFFKREGLGIGTLFFIPFLLNENDGAQLFIEYGKENKRSKGKEGGGA